MKLSPTFPGFLAWRIRITITRSHADLLQFFGGNKDLNSFLEQFQNQYNLILFLDTCGIIRRKVFAQCFEKDSQLRQPTDMSNRNLFKGQGSASTRLNASMSKGGHEVDRGDCFDIRQNEDFYKEIKMYKVKELVRERSYGRLWKREVNRFFDILCNSRQSAL